MNKKFRWVVVLALGLSTACAHIQFAPQYNTPLVKAPIYNLKVGVVNFLDNRTDRSFDSHFLGGKVSALYARYLAEDLRNSGLFSDVVYIDADPGSARQSERLRKENNIDIIITGSIDAWKLDSNFSALNLLYVFGGLWWVSFNAIGLPIPPFVGLYTPEFEVSLEIRNVSDGTILRDRANVAGEPFYSPTTFWYHLVTKGKLEEMLKMVKKATRGIARRMETNYKLHQMNEPKDVQPDTPNDPAW